LIYNPIPKEARQAMDEWIRMLEQVPIFEDFSEQELLDVLPLFKEKTYKKGAILFLEGEIGEELFIIRSGLVKIYRLEQNKEITLSLFRDGDFFGEMSLIQKGATRSATAETIEPSTFLTLNRGDFVRFMEASPKLCLRLLEVTMQRLRKANDKIHDLTFLDVRSRIVKTILRLHDEYGVPHRDGTMIDLKLTHQQIANMVGTVRESVTKVLQELQDGKIIAIDKKRILVLQPGKLKQSIYY
jgi:CRP/FNR family transcriptional regulator